MPRGREQTGQDNTGAEAQDKRTQEAEDYSATAKRISRFMEIAVIVSSALAAIGAVLIGILLYYHKQTPTVWVAFATVVLISLAACCAWQNGIWKTEAAKRADDGNQPTTRAAVEPQPNQEDNKMPDEKPKDSPSMKQKSVNANTNVQAGRDAHVTINPPREEPPRPIQKLSVSVEETSSQREDLPYGLAVILHTTVPINPVHIAVVCDGPIGDARVMFSPPPSAAAFGSSMFGKTQKIDGEVYEFSFANPPFTPRGPLEVKLFSAHKIRVREVKIID